MKKDSKKKVRGAGRVAFLARQEGIKKMIEAGHPLVSVYQEYEDELTIKYGQFAKYVNKFIRNKSPENKTAKPGLKIADKNLSTSEMYDLPIDKKDIF